jgi:hypothetical protein
MLERKREEMKEIRELLVQDETEEREVVKREDDGTRRWKKERCCRRSRGYRSTWPKPKKDVARVIAQRVVVTAIVRGGVCVMFSK